MAFSDLHEIGDMFACLQVPEKSGLGRALRSRDDEWERFSRQAHVKPYRKIMDAEKSAAREVDEKSGRLLHLVSERRDRKDVLKSRVPEKTGPCCGRPVYAKSMCQRCYKASRVGVKS